MALNIIRVMKNADFILMSVWVFLIVLGMDMSNFIASSLAGNTGSLLRVSISQEQNACEPLSLIFEPMISPKKSLNSAGFIHRGLHSGFISHNIHNTTKNTIKISHFLRDFMTTILLIKQKSCVCLSLSLTSCSDIIKGRRLYMCSFAMWGC